MYQSFSANHTQANEVIAANAADSMKTVIMLYDGAINFLKKAIEYAENGDLKNKNVYANKAADIIVELNTCLNMEKGGEIADNLSSVYVFMGRNLVDAILNDNVRGLSEVIKMLSNLKEGWEHVVGIAAGMESGQAIMSN